MLNIIFEFGLQKLSIEKKMEIKEKPFPQRIKNYINRGPIF